MKFLFLSFLVAVAAVNGQSDAVICESKYGFDKTVDKITSKIEAAGTELLTPTLVDFADEAAGAISPNTLIVFGNPDLGGDLMQANRQVALDLPKKIQVLRDGKDVTVAYSPSSFLEGRHDGLEDLYPVLDDIDDLYETVVGVTAKKCKKSKGAKKGKKAKKAKKSKKGGMEKAMEEIGPSDGMRTEESMKSFEATWEDLQSFIVDDPRVKLFFTVDHKANDPDGLLGPTSLAVFGNVPDVGVPLIMSNPYVVLDLPLKALVWEDDDEKVYVTVNEVDFIKERHGLQGVDDILNNVEALFMDLIDASTLETT